MMYVKISYDVNLPIRDTRAVLAIRFCSRFCTYNQIIRTTGAYCQACN